MKHLTITLLTLLVSGGLWSDSITEKQAISKLNQFFNLLDIEIYQKEKILTILTDDFQIFEMGKAWDMNEFDEFLQDASKTTVSTDWVLSNYVVSIDDNSAHISYVNDGVFKTTDDESIISNWLESVYLVREGGELKLKFLQADVVKRETK